MGFVKYEQSRLGGSTKFAAFVGGGYRGQIDHSRRARQPVRSPQPQLSEKCLSDASFVRFPGLAPTGGADRVHGVGVYLASCAQFLLANLGAGCITFPRSKNRRSEPKRLCAITLNVTVSGGVVTTQTFRRQSYRIRLYTSKHERETTFSQGAGVPLCQEPLPHGSRSGVASSLV